MSKTNSTDAIKAIRERRAGITPAPWIVQQGRKYPHIKSANGAYIQEFGREVRRQYDAEFIANAPADIDYLLSALEESERRPSCCAACAICRGEIGVIITTLGDQGVKDKQIDFLRSELSAAKEEIDRLNGRDTCAICSAELLPPTEPPHCEGCVVTDDL
jgi:hypothetical protein